VDVGADRTIGDIKVHQSLGYGLDEKAEECVRKWRFNSATNDGQPVKGTAWIEMNFYLQDKRPDRPSPGPVSRPTPPPRLPSVEMTFPTDLDDFLYLVAVNFSAPALCQRIHPMSMGGGAGFSPRGYQTQTQQSKFYFSLATELHDAKLCDQVKPVRTDALDGSKMDKTYCLAQILQGYHTGAVPDPHRMGPFVGFMRKLGYDDQQIAEFSYKRSLYNNPTHAAYDKLRADRGFLNRVHAGRSYAEPISKAKVRPAHAVEYLYEMVAVDNKDPDLCGKVSPNATFVDLFKRTALLRAECYRDLAFNERKASLCDQLPRSGELAHAAHESREGCHETAAVYSRPDFNAGVHYGPSFFPHPTYFEQALQQIGYSEAFTGSLVRKPTPDDYWEFLETMALRGSAQDRAEFVRRVMSLE